MSIYTSHRGAGHPAFSPPGSLGQEAGASRAIPASELHRHIPVTRKLRRRGSVGPKASHGEAGLMVAVPTQSVRAASPGFLLHRAEGVGHPGPLREKRSTTNTRIRLLGCSRSLLC